MIRSSVVNQVIAAILACPGGAAYLRRQHDIKSTRADLYDRIALGRYLALFEDAATLAKDPLFGARLGHTLPAGELLGPLGFLVLTSPRLRVGLQTMTHYISTWQDATDITLHDQEDTAIWSYRITDDKLWPRRQDAEFTLTATCAMIRTCCGSNWTPLEVHFEHPRPRDLHGLQAMFRAPLRFNQPANALIMDLADLDRPIQGANAGFAPFLRRHIEDMLANEQQELHLTQQVRQVVMRDLGRAPVSVTSVATELGIKPRTLQRYLAEEGSSVRDILRTARQDQAKSLLSTSHRQIEAVAHAVGYTDPSAFWRAFKTWEGQPPAAYARTRKGKT
jgi:AraC-like DNA-binding protein